MATAACGATATRDLHTTRVLVPTYLFGTLGARTLDLQELCGGLPSGELEVEPTWSTVMLGVLTLGTYTPVEIRVQCSDPRSIARRRAAH